MIKIFLPGRKFVVTTIVFAAAFLVYLFMATPSHAALGPCYPYGDVDYNLDVGPSDTNAVLVASAYVHSEVISGNLYYLSTGDVDDNGVNNPIDALLISQYVGGIIGTFPICTHIINNQGGTGVNPAPRYRSPPPCNPTGIIDTAPWVGFNKLQYVTDGDALLTILYSASLPIAAFVSPAQKEQADVFQHSHNPPPNPIPTDAEVVLQYIHQVPALTDYYNGGATNGTSCPIFRVSSSPSGITIPGVAAGSGYIQGLGPGGPTPHFITFGTDLNAYPQSPTYTATLTAPLSTVVAGNTYNFSNWGVAPGGTNGCASISGGSGEVCTLRTSVGVGSSAVDLKDSSNAWTLGASPNPPGIRMPQANYVLAPNILNVQSRVNGVLTPGASIAGTQAGTSGTTQYTVNMGGSISTVLTDNTPTLGGAPFVNWTGCDSTSGNTCTVAVSGGGSKTVTANYTIPPNVLNVQSRVGGVLTPGASIAGTQAGTSGTTQYTVTMVANISTVLTDNTPVLAGANFVNWTGCDSTSGNTCTVAVSGGATKTVTANYTPPNILNVQSRVNGVLTPGASIAGTQAGTSGTTQYTVTMAANISTVLTDNTPTLAGAGFVNWTGCDSTSGTQCTVAVSGGATKTVTANYAINTLNVRSTIHGASVPGDVITQVAGAPAGMDGTTNYTRTSSSTIDVTLEAPFSYTGAQCNGTCNFISWAGCSSTSAALPGEPIARRCRATVSGGASQTITVNYGSPDLVVTNNPIAFNPSLTCGTAITFTAQLRNSGDADTLTQPPGLPAQMISFGTQFTVDPASATPWNAGTGNTAGLTHGSSTAVTSDPARAWTATIGAHVLRVYTDYINQVSNEWNAAGTAESLVPNVSNVRDFNFNVVCTPDFTITVTPLTSQPVGMNQAGITYQVSLTSINGFNSAVNGNINLTVAPSPVAPLVINQVFSLNPVALPAGGTRTSNFTFDTNGTPPATYTFTVTGTAGALSHSATATLQVADDPWYQTTDGDVGSFGGFTTNKVGAAFVETEYLGICPHGHCTATLTNFQSVKGWLVGDYGAPSTPSSLLPDPVLTSANLYSTLSQRWSSKCSGSIPTISSSPINNTKINTAASGACKVVRYTGGGTVNLTMTPYSGPSAIILVPGNMRITSGFTIAADRGLIFVVDGDITITSGSDPLTIDGVYFAKGLFYTDNSGTCHTSAASYNNPLTINGSVYGFSSINVGGTNYGGVCLNRRRSNNGVGNPAEIFNLQAKYLYLFKDVAGESQPTYTEVTP